MNKKSKQISFGGIICALSIVFLSLSSLIPMLEYTSPALAGGILGFLVIEFNKKTAITAYIAVSLLSLITIPNKEVVVIFIGFFGIYPIVKSVVEPLKNGLIATLIKFVVFNVCIILSYLLIVNVFGIPEVLSDFEKFGHYSIAILLAAGNGAFYLYDIVLSRVYILYIKRISARLNLR